MNRGGGGSGGRGKKREALRRARCGKKKVGRCGENWEAKKEGTGGGKMRADVVGAGEKKRAAGSIKRGRKNERSKAFFQEKRIRTFERERSGRCGGKKGKSGRGEGKKVSALALAKGP